jgi:hypothetical protein
MAHIQFDLADTRATRKDLHSLGAEFTAKSGTLHVDLPDVIESEALFLAIKAIVSHGAVSHAPEGERVTPEQSEALARKDTSLEDYSREEGRVSAAKTDRDAERLSTEEASARQKKEQSTVKQTADEKRESEEKSAPSKTPGSKKDAK